MFQVAFSIVLLMATGLLVRTFVNLQTTDLGYQTENVIVFRARLDNARFPFNDLQVRFDAYRQLIDRLEEVPGVTSAGGVSIVPLDGQNNLLSFKTDGQIGEQNADFRWVTEQIVQAADSSASDRIVSVLEGGYELHSLARCVETHIRVLMGLH